MGENKNDNERIDEGKGDEKYIFFQKFQGWRPIFVDDRAKISRYFMDIIDKLKAQKVCVNVCVKCVCNCVKCMCILFCLCVMERS